MKNTRRISEVQCQKTLEECKKCPSFVSEQTSEKGHNYYCSKV